MGDPEKGLPFGKIVEVSGQSSHGKSAFALDLVAAAQEYGARCVWIDFENSFDVEWSQRRGVNTDELLVVSPFVGMFPGEKQPRLSTAEEVLEEAEASLVQFHQAEPSRPMFVVVDSIASMLVGEEAEGGVDGQNLRSRIGLASFLSGFLRRWIGLLQTLDATALMINQLRVNPMAFGDPHYTPGGNALPFYAHVRVRMRRGKKGGRILKGGKIVGIHGVLRNDKNKAGGVEGASCLFRIYFDGRSVFQDVEEQEDASE
jgi:RecA/RadA recombinase